MIRHMESPMSREKNVDPVGPRSLRRRSVGRGIELLEMGGAEPEYRIRP